MLTFTHFSDNHKLPKQKHNQENDSRKDKLHKKMREYASSFTVHGLNRVAASDSKVERIIWSITVMTAAVVAVYLIKWDILKYKKHDVFHDYSTVTLKKAYFPSITFCLTKLKLDLDDYYCGLHVDEFPAKELHCQHNKPLCRPPKIVIDSFWGNGVFNVHVKNDSSYSELEKCRGLKSKQNGACMTWNANRYFYEKGSGFEIDILIAKYFVKGDNTLKVYIHNHDIDSEYLLPKLKLMPDKVYYLSLQKTITRRLPHPYPSNCTNRYLDLHHDGGYNRRDCLIRHHFINIFKKYGVIHDTGRKVIPTSILQRFETNMTRENVTAAYKEAWVNNINLEDDNCPLPCYEVNYDVYSFITEVQSKPYFDQSWVKAETNRSKNTCYTSDISPKLSRNFLHYRVKLGYQNIESYFLMKEKPMYGWDQMIAELGGLLGLLIGASALSVLEIIFYLIMAVIRRLPSKTPAHYTRKLTIS